MRAHAVEGPTEIHGGRARREEGGVSAGQGGIGRIGAEREPQAPGRGGADQRRAAHEHGANGVRGVVEGGEPGGDERVREARLIDDLDGDPVGGRPDSAGGAAGDIHGEGIWGEPAGGATRQ